MANERRAGVGGGAVPVAEQSAPVGHDADKAKAEAEAKAKEDADAAAAKAESDAKEAKAASDKAKAEAEAKAKREPRYHVAPGKALTTGRGVLGPGAEMFAKDVSNGVKQLDYLASRGHLVKS